MRKKVLLVDDEVLQLELLTEILGRKNYEVYPASSVLQAQGLLEKVHCDILITDIRMPGMSGIELVKWIKIKNPSLLHRTIVTTGDSCNPRLLEYLQEESLKVVMKPYNVRHLLALIEEKLVSPAKYN